MLSDNPVAVWLNASRLKASIMRSLVVEISETFGVVDLLASYDHICRFFNGRNDTAFLGLSLYYTIT